MRSTRRFVLALVAMALAFVALASPAHAHASLLEATPADGARLEVGPEKVVLRYNEAVSVTGNSVRVLDTDGNRVDDGRPEARGSEVSVGLDSDLRDDTYIVAWRVVSTDTHTVHGATTFVVGSGPQASDETIAGLLGDQGDGAWPAIGAVARALAYGGGLLVIGAVAWMVTVDHGAIRRPVRRLALLGGLVGAVGVLLTLPVQAAITTGLGFDAVTDTAVLSDVVRSPLGAGAALTGIGLLVVAIVVRKPRHTALSAATSTERLTQPSAGAPTESPTASRTRLTVVVALLGALLIAIGFARSGHTETTDPRWLMYGADIIHVVTAGAWLGGLFLVGGELVATRRGTVAAPTAAERLARFSALAAVVSILAGAAGVVLSWGTVRSLEALTTTTFGRVLLVKVGLVAIVAAIAAYNHWWLLPAVRKGNADARRLLHDTVRIELLGLLAAVVVTASLVNLEPARVAAAPGMFDSTLSFGENTAVIQVDPARAGVNTLHMYLLDPAGRQLDLPEIPTFSFRLESEEVGPITRTPWRVGPGHYILDGPELSLRGTWTIEIRARTSTFEETTASVDVRIR